VSEDCMSRKSRLVNVAERRSTQNATIGSKDGFEPVVDVEEG